MHINFYDVNDFSVEFNNVTRKAKTIYTDTSTNIKSGAGAASTISLKGHDWDNASKDSAIAVKALDDGILSYGKGIKGEIKKDTEVASTFSLVRNSEKDNESEVVIDNRGVLVYDKTVFEDGSQSKDVVALTSGRLLFSDDDLKTTKMAVGRADITNKKTGETKSQFGVFADFCISTYFQGGDIYSNNYETGKSGTHIDLDNGTFEFNGTNTRIAFDGDDITIVAKIEGGMGSINVIETEETTITQGTFTGNSYFISEAYHPFGEDVEGNTGIEQIKEIIANSVVTLEFETVDIDFTTEY